MDRKSSRFAVKGFKANVLLLEDLSPFKKVVKSLEGMLPKAVSDKYKVSGLPKVAEKMVSDGSKFPDIISYFETWSDNTLESFESEPDSFFESQKGKKAAEETTLNFLGKVALVPVHAAGLLKGSKLAEFLNSGLPQNFAEYRELQTVCNAISKGMSGLIPDSVRKVWKEERTEAKSKKKADKENSEQPETPETLEA